MSRHSSAVHLDQKIKEKNCLLTNNQNRPDGRSTLSADGPGYTAGLPLGC